ncbi:MAG TPA: energy transducer TonB [Acidobacteriaceae bacterium]|nr:energy transducer TonB [Acidobacteriaceae bacterium]
MNVRACVWASLCLVAASPARAQTPPTQQSVEARLQGPFLMLRGLYNTSRLEFNAHGELKNLAGIMPFSLSAIRVENVRLTDSRLEIDAVREGLEFSRPQQPGEPAPIAATVWDPTEQVRIVIARDRHRPDALYAAIAKVFSSGFDDALVAAAPDYWQPWLRHDLHPADPAGRLRTLLDQEGRTMSCRDSDLTPPRLVQPVDPDYSDAARMARYQGTVVVHMTVALNGEPQGLFILRPLGMGLDEQAVDAARRYQFTPAAANGTPVACETNVIVTFRLGQP